MTKFIVFMCMILPLSSCSFLADNQQIQTHTVGIGSVQKTIRFAGRIGSEDSVLVRSPFDAHLVELKASLGQKVERGQPIAIVTRPEDVNKNSQFMQKEGLLTQLKLKQEKLRLQIKNTAAQYKKLKRLLKTGSVSAREVEKVKVQQKLEEKELKIIESKISTNAGEVDYLAVKRQEDGQVLIAPIDGLITQLWTDESQVTKGMSIDKDTVVAVVEKFGRFNLKGEVSEPDYIQMKIGQVVKINLTYVDGVDWEGRLKSLSPRSQSRVLGVNRFSVIAVFEAQEKSVKTGLEGIATIEVDQRANTLTVPRSALNKINERYFASAPDGSSTKAIPVEVGLIGDYNVEILNGLTENQVIFKDYKVSRQ